MSTQTNADPLRSDRNNVGTEPLGIMGQEKRKKMAEAALNSEDGKVPSDFSDTREDYRANKKANRLARQAEGQQVSAVGDFMKSGLGVGLTQGLSLASDIGSQFIDRDTTKNATGFDTQQQIGNALIASGNPYAAIAGVAMKGLSTIAEATGTNVHTITKNQAEDIGLSK